MRFDNHTKPYLNFGFILINHAALAASFMKNGYSLPQHCQLKLLYWEIMRERESWEGREAKQQVKEIKLGQMSDAVEVGLESLVWLVVKDPFTVSLLPFDPTNGPSSCQIQLTEEYKMLDVHQ